MKTVYILFTTALFFSACNSAKTDNRAIDFKNDNYTILTLIEEDVSASNMTISFDTEAKRISGNAGCNSYFGGYALTGNAISFTKMGATKKYCPDKEVSKKEKALLNAFSEVVKITMSTSDEVLLKNKDNQILITAKVQ